MAKGNLFLGMAAGSVGDVVFYRSNGAQITRARNRRPSNPKTLRQTLQRAVLASVSRLYNVGRPIFDHSWQGEKVGAGSQRGFLRDNLPILRSLAVQEINAATSRDDARTRVSAPRVSVAVPFDGMKISSGSYDQMFFLRSVHGGLTYFNAPGPLEGETVAEYAQRNGLIAGDIYTFLAIAVGIMSDGNVVYDFNPPGATPPDGWLQVFQSRLSYCQLMVRADLAQNTDAITAATTFATFFEVYDASGVEADLSNHLLEGNIELSDIDDVYSAGVLGVIRSREDSGLRSTSHAYFSTSSDYGLTPDVLLDAWSAEGQTIAGAELILEGENFT